MRQTPKRGTDHETIHARKVNVRAPKKVKGDMRSQQEKFPEDEPGWWNDHWQVKRYDEYPDRRWFAVGCEYFRGK